MANTGLVVEPSRWSKAKGLPLGRNAFDKELLLKLKGLEAHLIENYNRSHAQGERFNTAWLKEVINSFFNRKEEVQLDYLTEYGRHYTNKNRKANEETKKDYLDCIQRLEGYEGHLGKRLLMHEINVAFQDDYTEYLSDHANLADSTIQKELSRIRSFGAHAYKHGFDVGIGLRSIKPESVKTYNTYLTFEDLGLVEVLDLSTKPVHEDVRDWLIIGCYTGQRISDLFRMKKRMIKEIDGYKYIELTQKKNYENRGVRVRIPIHPWVKEVLKRRGDFPGLWSSSNGSNATIFNRYVKEVCKLAGINELTEGALRNPSTGKYEKGEYEKWRLISSHTCRRSFATNFYGQPGYTTPLLMSITGHRKEETFLKYIKKAPIDYSKQLAELWQNEGPRGEDIVTIYD
ncbi:phage integrase SAM-like domain-containing protein [Cryomorphaceae bacterium]|nr:phage integrase SAM-like domain-containing protein [Cryomorphaceae bacterium]